MDEHKTISPDEVNKWCSAAMFMTTEELAINWLAEILNGEYPLDDARGDILSFREFINKPRPAPGKEGK